MRRSRSTASRLALLAALLGSGVGCGPGDGGPGSDAAADDGGSMEDAGPLAAELGSGETEFEPIADGAELPYVLGAQGGFHFFGSVRVSGIAPGNPDDPADPGNPTMSFRVLRDSERIDKGGAVYQQGLDPVRGSPGTYEMVGRRVILDIVTCDELEGASVRFEVEVEGADGVTARDSRTVTAVNHPINGCS